MKKKLIGASGLVRDFHDWVKTDVDHDGCFYNHSVFRDRFRDYLESIPEEQLTYTVPSDRSIKSCICILQNRGIIERIERGVYKLK
jgi:hypothetical protein